MDTGYRTGVFYQAMPAVGADGKNIMKLIPVQMVNGQFVQTVMGRPATDAPLQKPNPRNDTTPLVQMSKQAVFNPSVTEQIIRKHFCGLNVPQNQTILGLNKQPLQQQTAASVCNIPQMGSHSAVCGNSLRPNQLLVTVKSPNLPKGQCLQIPPNAQVRTVPASELPPAIKKQIFTSSASSSAGLDKSSVVYVSPVTTVSQGVTPPNELLSHRPLSSTTKMTMCRIAEKVTKPHLKLIPKVSQRPNSPIRWEIEEVEDSAPHLKSVDASSETTNLRTPEERGNSGDHYNVTKPESHLSQDNGVKGQENALVMCNGKVFLLAKKSSLTVEPTATAQSSESNNTVSSSPQRNLTDEVIDLCDDDAQDVSPEKVVPITTSTLSHQDEDNVIFVSYIPPKSCLVHKPPPTVSVAAVTDLTHSTSEQNTSTSKVGNMEVEKETADPKDIESSNHELESSTCPATVLIPPVAPQQHQMTDHVLRQIFGITSDVKICLQRIDEMSVFTFPLHTEEPASGSKTKLEEGHSLQESHTFSGQQHSATPLKKSHFTNPSPALLQKCLLDSFNGTPCDRETEQVIGYVAPIDEDFPSTDENNMSVAQDGAGCTQTCTDLTTIIRRMGRMRKRTMCPCCIPATLDPALKYSTRLEETEKWAMISEDTTKKGGRTKTSRKDGRTSGRVSCAAAKNKQNCKSHDVYESVDSEEMKKIEQKTQQPPEEKT